MNALLKSFFLMSLTALLSACGGGTTENTLDTLDTVDTSSRITIGGSVGDGPIVGASVSVKSRDGMVLANTTSDQQANYSLSVDTQPAHFPLILEATNGIDLVTGTSPDFILLSVVPDAQTARANLNPHSTAIVKTAMAMAGGLNAENLQRARQAVVEKLNFGLDSALAGDPIGLTVDSGNVAVLTHASEALAEMLRRTSTTLGASESEDSVLDALAADLSDGILDGLGAAGSNPRYTAVAQAIGLQVLIESMLHDLQVNGVAADSALATAIQTVMANSNLTVIHDGSTLIKREMIGQAKAALAAILAIDNQDMYNKLWLALQALGDESSTVGLTAALSANGIDATISGSLDSSIGLVVAASNDQIIAFNTAANNVNSGPGANQAPVISGTPAGMVAEGEAYSFTPSALDADGDNLNFSVSNPPAWASFDDANGTLSGTPGFSDAGDYNNITISVSDGAASASLNPFTIRVGGSNRTPGISGNPDTSVTEGQPYNFTPSAADADGDAISFSVANLPNWANFDGVTGTLSGTPSFTDAGVYSNIVISVSDGSASASLNAFAISVQDINRAPSISGTPSTSVAEGAAYSFTPTATDPDGNAISFIATNLPAWASINSSNGMLTGTPGVNDAGVYSNIVISVSDGTASAMLDPFSITVTDTPVPGAPTLTSANLSGTSVILAWNQSNAVPLGGYDIFVDGVDTGPDNRTPLLTATIPNMDPSVSHCFTIEARYTDTTQFFNSNELCTQAVAPTNNAPTISGTPNPSAAEGGSYSFTPNAADADGDTLTFSITGKPAWASFNTANGRLSGTPGYDDVGSYNNILIRVTDGVATASLAAFSINVANTNRAPSISGSPAVSVNEGELYSFTPIAADADGDTLTFSITDQPAWASFDTANGRLSGTPGYDDAGSYNNIVIRVTDGVAAASLAAFSINVANTNRAPSISGSPAVSVSEGELYSFTPIAADADGDPLSFSAAGLPAWASLDVTTGRISGTPGATDVGVYQDIVISVTDGTAVAAMSPISITVNAATTVSGFANLAWQIPTTRTDGSPLALSDIAGYRVYMGPASDNLSMVVDLNDGTATNHSVTDLAPGTYYFSVTSYDIDGNESSFSNIAQKTIQ